MILVLWDGNENEALVNHQKKWILLGDFSFLEFLCNNLEEWNGRLRNRSMREEDDEENRKKIRETFWNHHGGSVVEHESNKLKEKDGEKRTLLTNLLENFEWKKVMWRERMKSVS